MRSARWCCTGCGALRASVLRQHLHVLLDMPLDDLLDLRLGHAGERDAVVVAEIDHRVAMHVGGDELLQFLDGLRAGQVIELDRVGLRIEVDDCVGANAWLEKEVVVAGTADRH